MHRKLTTIVAADIAGYSRLVHDNEEATLETMHQRRQQLIDPLIEKHGGRLANTAGDSLLLEFPSAIEAVRFAIAMQSGMNEMNSGIAVDQRIDFRIGINAGDVVVENGDLLGDGVNVAARLESLADPGGVLLSRAVQEQICDHLDIRLRDLGSIAVKNIARPVPTFKVEGIDGSRPGKLSRKRRRKIYWIVIASALLLLAAATGWWILQSDFEPADQNNLSYRLPDKPSIAVLPFENLSGDSGQDVLAASFSEDIQTSLSKLSGLFVISGSSGSAFESGAHSIKQVAEAFGIRYVLRGNLQRDGQRIRINAQLIDAFDGRVIWSDRLERQIGDLFEVKDDISLGIISSIGAKLELGESDKMRSRETSSLDAWLLQREGWAAVQRLNPQDNLRGRDLLRQAIEIDPAFATAYANLATSYRFDYQMGWNENREAANLKAFELYQKALDLDPEHAIATASLASWHLTNGNLEKALALADRAVELEPNNYFVHGFHGMALIHAGSTGKAVQALELSVRLSPRGPDWILFKLSEAYLVQGNAAKAAEAAKTLLDRPPSSPSNRNIAHINYALALDTLGKTEAARNQIEAAVSAYPARTLEVWQRQRPYADPDVQAEWSATLKSLGMP